MTGWTPARGRVRRDLNGKTRTEVEREADTLRFLERQHGKVVITAEDEARLDRDAEMVDEAEAILTWMDDLGVDVFRRTSYEEAADA